MRKLNWQWSAILLALGLSGSPLGAAERPADATSPPRANARLSQPIRTLDDFFERLAIQYDFRGEPQPEWVAEQGAPPLNPDALRLALTDSLRDAQGLAEVAKGLEATLAGQQERLSPAGKGQVRAQVAKIKWHAQQLLADPYLEFLDMGRAGKTSPASVQSSPLHAAQMIRKNAEEVRLGLELFFQGESHRVVDWRQLSSPSPRALSKRIFQLVREVEKGLSNPSAGAELLVSDK